MLEIYYNLPRQSPGDDQSTTRAFNLIKNDLGADCQLLELGCGSGGATLILAQLIEGKIIATDIYPSFLAELANKAIARGISAKIQIQIADMCDLPFSDDTFDVIWSEGAIYNIGFKEGLTQWRKFLKTQGFLVVSELSWLTYDNLPEPIKDYWKHDYPAMITTEENLKLIEQLGYKLIDYFIIPESGWWNYYLPLSDKIQGQEDNYPELVTEINNYRLYSNYYEYVFYIMRKI